MESMLLLSNNDFLLCGFWSRDAWIFVKILGNMLNYISFCSSCDAISSKCKNSYYMC